MPARGTTAGGGSAGHRFGTDRAGAAAGARPDLRKQSHRSGGIDAARRRGPEDLSPCSGRARRNQPGAGGRFQPMRCGRDFRRRFGRGNGFPQAAFEQVGGELEFWKVAIKPGRPFVFGRCRGKLLFGLPGNPVSALVTFLLLVRPALLRWQGATDVSLPAHPGVLAEPLANPGERRHFMRVKVDPTGKIHIGRPSSFPRAQFAGRGQRAGGCAGSHHPGCGKRRDRAALGLLTERPRRGRERGRDGATLLRLDVGKAGVGLVCPSARAFTSGSAARTKQGIDNVQSVPRGRWAGLNWESSAGPPPGSMPVTAHRR